MSSQASTILALPTQFSLVFIIDMSHHWAAKTLREVMQAHLVTVLIERDCIFAVALLAFTVLGGFVCQQALLSWLPGKWRDQLVKGSEGANSGTGAM